VARQTNKLSGLEKKIQQKQQGMQLPGYATSVPEDVQEKDRQFLQTMLQEADEIREVLKNLKS
jgi:hypothetical protein